MVLILWHIPAFKYSFIWEWIMKHSHLAFYCFRQAAERLLQLCWFRGLVAEFTHCLNALHFLGGNARLLGCGVVAATGEVLLSRWTATVCKYRKKEPHLWVPQWWRVSTWWHSSLNSVLYKPTDLKGQHDYWFVWSFGCDRSHPFEWASCKTIQLNSEHLTGLCWMCTLFNYNIPLLFSLSLSLPSYRY